MKTKVTSLLLLTAILLSSFLCSCELPFISNFFFNEENKNIEITIGCTNPLSGMKFSDIEFTVTVNGEKADCTCTWSKESDGASEEEEQNDVFEPVTSYHADVCYFIPAGCEYELLSFVGSIGDGKIKDNTYDSTTGAVKSHIVFNIKKLIEIDGTFPEEGKKVSDMKYSVKVDGESTEFTAVWNEHNGGIRQMKPDEAFASDIFYSLDLTYYITAGTDYEYLDFRGNMGGGEYNGSGYIEQTGEVWSHVKFDPENADMTHEVDIKIATPMPGQTPSEIECTVTHNGEVIPCTVFWTNLDLNNGNSSSGTLSEDGTFASGSHVAATVKINIGNIRLLDSVVITTTDNCRESSRKYTPADENGTEASLSVVLTFDKLDSETEDAPTTTKKETDNDTTTAPPKTVNNAGKDGCNHNYKLDSHTDPTCTADGYSTYKCSKCGASYTETALKTGHSYKEKITTAPTCTSEGTKTSICSKCSDTVTESIPKTAHSFEETTVEATCTAAGYTKYTCKVCKYSYNANETPLANHQYVERIVSEKTCTSDGITEFTCSVCGHSYTEKDPATGHNITAWKANTTSLTHSGTCTICGETVTQGHTPGDYTFVDGKWHSTQCTVCGFSWRESHSGNPCSVCGGENNG